MSDRPTPETDEVELGIANNPRRDPQFRLAIHARYLERQRDAYAETLRFMAETDEDWNLIRERHPEIAGNDQSLARRASGSE